MLTNESKDKFIDACNKFNIRLKNQGDNSIWVEEASAKEDMNVLVLHVSLEKPLSDMHNLPFFCFIHEDQLSFLITLAKVREDLMPTAFHLINDLNSSYPHYKFVYSENDNHFDEIEMKYYIDVKYIQEPFDWADIAFGFGINLDICLGEYRKGWELFYN